ncbi:hypothetical protein [Amnibacterium endophyticum]|uniref:DUF1648 domain-containing protein n=1 Tax=Amnibacterium endophyticum TaxID=2109337 RepID=A0ABW4LIJ0_9MICO
MRALKASVALLLAGAPLAAIVLAGVVLKPRLGAVTASHWSGTAVRPDGFTSTEPMFWTSAAITTVLGVGGLVGVVAVARGRGSRVWPAVASLAAGLTACAWIAAAWATADAADVQRAALGARLAIMLIPAALAVCVYLLLPATPVQETEAATVPALPAGSGDRLAWSGTTGSPVLAVVVSVVALLFAAMLAAAVISREPAVVISAVVLLLATLAALLLEPVRLTVDRRGVRLRSALLRVPLIRVRLSDIAEVVTDTIEPARWGGWGYRVSGAGIAYVARRGPGIVVKRRNGTAVAITVDRPEDPAAVANTLSRLASSGSAPERR